MMKTTLAPLLTTGTRDSHPEAARVKVRPQAGPRSTLWSNGSTPTHEARGNNRGAADCYRKMRDIMRQRPDDYEQNFETEFAELIDWLDPPPAT